MQQHLLSLLITCVTTAAVTSLSACSAGGEEAEQIITEVSVQVGKVSRVTLHTYVEAYGMVESEPAGGGKSGLQDS